MKVNYRGLRIAKLTKTKVVAEESNEYNSACERKLFVPQESYIYHLYADSTNKYPMGLNNTLKSFHLYFNAEKTNFLNIY